MTAAAWHPDPTGQHELRYWDGTQWTDHVSDNGVQTVSPLEPAAEPATEAATEAAERPAGTDPGVRGQQPPGNAFAGIAGDLVSGEYSEKAGTGPSRQNKRMLRVRIAEPFMAKQGAMVAFQGNVNFAYQGGGAGRFLKKAITGEGLALMRVEGQGDVFLADLAKEVHILHLDNSGLSINGKNVLAFSTTLDWNVERIKGGSMLAGGLFNTTLRGTGWVAITTDGDPVVLNPGEAPTFADANALVAWSTSLQTALRSTVTAGALIGRGSGEAFQVSFQGHGFVIVQPSEGLPEPAPSA